MQSGHGGDEEKHNAHIERYLSDSFSVAGSGVQNRASHLIAHNKPNVQAGGNSLDGTGRSGYHGRANNKEKQMGETPGYTKGGDRMQKKGE